jgi:hypothetical protein
MKLTFHSLALLYSVVCFTIALIWLIEPHLPFAAWHAEFSEPADLVGHQSGALYAGFGVTFFFARNAEPSSMRTSFIRGFGVSCVILAGLDVAAFANGRAGPGILLDVVVEIALVLLMAFAVGIGPAPSNSRFLDVRHGDRAR